jgi:hypothetical protein
MWIEVAGLENVKGYVEVGRFVWSNCIGQSKTDSPESQEESQQKDGGEQPVQSLN